MHRVKNSPTKHRISAPFFFQPRLDCVIKSLDDDLFNKSGSETYNTKLVLNSPFTFGEYLLNKFKKSYGKK